MAKTNVLHAANEENRQSEQAVRIFAEIIMLAEAIAQLATAQVADDSEDFDVHKAVAIRALAHQAGMLADLGGTKVGGPGYRGGAEEWLLPPNYHRESV